MRGQKTSKTWHASGGNTVYTCRHHRTLKSMMLSCYDLRHVDMADNALPRQYITIMWGCGAHTPVPTQRLDDVPATWSHLFPRLPCRTRFIFFYLPHTQKEISLAWPSIEYVRTRHHHIVSHTTSRTNPIVFTFFKLFPYFNFSYYFYKGR